MEFGTSSSTESGVPDPYPPRPSFKTRKPGSFLLLKLYCRKLGKNPVFGSVFARGIVTFRYCYFFRTLFNSHSNKILLWNCMNVSFFFVSNLIMEFFWYIFYEVKEGSRNMEIPLIVSCHGAHLIKNCFCLDFFIIWDEEQTKKPVLLRHVRYSSREYDELKSRVHAN